VTRLRAPMVEVRTVEASWSKAMNTNVTLLATLLVSLQLEPGAKRYYSKTTKSLLRGSAGRFD
jgi:hypothetical protein